jgi:hypothetical protein
MNPWRRWCILAIVVALISAFVFLQTGGPHRPTTMTALVAGLICIDAAVAAFLLGFVAWQKGRQVSRNR